MLTSQPKSVETRIKNEKICRDGVPKSTQTREDIKVKVNIQSPVPTSSLYCNKNVGIDEDLYTNLPSLIYRTAGAMGDNGWFMGALSLSN